MCKCANLLMCKWRGSHLHISKLAHLHINYFSIITFLTILPLGFVITNRCTPAVYF
jgi:hypothetical protein